MHSLQFTAESSSDGMLERDFTVAGVPGVLWSPASNAADRAPLILMAHGGGNHKKHPAMSGRAQRLVTGCGFHVAVIDAPGHGDRPRTAHDEAEIAELFRARAAGEPEGPIVVRYNDHLGGARRARVPGDPGRPPGTPGDRHRWAGRLLGHQHGHRDRRTVRGDRTQDHRRGLRSALADVLAEKAKQISIPIEFDMQWDDEHISREEGVALFGAFASKEKTLHANAGRHKELPRFEADTAVRFFARHLGRAVTSSA